MRKVSVSTVLIAGLFTGSLVLGPGCRADSGEQGDLDGAETGGGAGALTGGAGHADGGSGATSGGGGDTGTPGGPGGGWSEKPEDCGPNCVRVRNYCPFSLWIYAAAHDGPVLQPADHELKPGESIDYPTPDKWESARVTAFKNGPRDGGGVQIEKAEMTIHARDEHHLTLNYNLTYVDWVGLPLEMEGVGEECNSQAHTTGCWTPVEEIHDGCPDPDLWTGETCLAPRSFCMDPNNHTRPICQALDSVIDECHSQGLGCPARVGDPSETGTPAVYGCNTGTWYGIHETMCAAMNRGMLHDPEEPDNSQFFQNEPYNIYSAWSHSVCPGVYSFSYDDVHAHGGFRACRGDELRITWCPGNAPD